MNNKNSINLNNKWNRNRKNLFDKTYEATLLILIVNLKVQFSLNLHLLDQSILLGNVNIEKLPLLDNSEYYEKVRC